MENSPPISVGSFELLSAGLEHRCGYSRERAQKIADELGHLDSRLYGAFWSWWTSGAIADAPTVQGQSIKSLIDNGRCRSVPVALLWLNGLITSPQRTRELLGANYDIILTEPPSARSPFDMNQ